MRERADRWDLLLIASPGWVLLAGTLGSVVVPHDTAWALAPFGIGIAVSFILNGIGERRRRGWEPAETPAGTWFARIGNQMAVNQGTVRRCATDLDLNPTAVTAVAWTPWWALLAFWTFLILTAVAGFIRP
ncbi:MAG: hypothetical protein ABI249_03205 [Ornithinibacter sp.]